METSRNQTDVENGKACKNLGMIRVSPDIWYIIAAISQLERELIVERVKNGLRNAKLKGKQIGRKKTRNSELIRSLLNSGMTLRAAARVANCSHGSVSLERAIMKREAIEAKKVSKEQLSQSVVSPQMEIGDQSAENPEGKINFSLSFA